MSKLPLVVDAHTHLFNARYVPLAGILHAWGVPKPANYLIEKVVLAITGKTRFETLNKEFVVSQAELVTEQVTDKLEEMAMLQLTDDLNAYGSVKGLSEQSEIFKALAEVEQVYGDNASALELQPDHLEQALKHSQQERIKGLGSGLLRLFSGIRRALKRLLGSIVSYVEKAADLVDFIFNMTKKEHEIMNRLTDYYQPLAEESLMVHYMMDMQYPYEDKPPFDFYQQQLPRM